MATEVPAVIPAPDSLRANGQPFWHGPRIAGDGYEILLEQQDNYVAAAVHGDLPIELFLSTMHVLGVESDGAPGDAMLVDLRQLATTYAATDLVRVGQEIATSFAHIERLALLVLPRQVTRISERAARKSGMNMRVFDSEPGAVVWVRGAHL
jgi:hypothetical protein